MSGTKGLETVVVPREDILKKTPSPNAYDELLMMPEVCSQQQISYFPQIQILQSKSTAYTLLLVL